MEYTRRATTRTFHARRDETVHKFWSNVLNALCEMETTLTMAGQLSAGEANEHLRSRKLMKVWRQYAVSELEPMQFNSRDIAAACVEWLGWER